MARRKDELDLMFDFSKNTYRLGKKIFSSSSKKATTKQKYNRNNTSKTLYADDGDNMMNILYIVISLFLFIMIDDNNFIRSIIAIIMLSYVIMFIIQVTKKDPLSSNIKNNHQYSEEFKEEKYTQDNYGLKIELEKTKANEKMFFGINKKKETDIAEYNHDNSNNILTLHQKIIQHETNPLLSDKNFNNSDTTVKDIGTQQYKISDTNTLKKQLSKTEFEKRALEKKHLQKEQENKQLRQEMEKLKKDLANTIKQQELQKNKKEKQQSHSKQDNEIDITKIVVRESFNDF